MALTISQVNQGFLALFGRPATGAEATKFASQADVATLANALLVDPLYTSELTASFPKIKTVDLNAATDDAFVESLYQALIGRASDAEGKTYWLGVKAAGATREEVLAQFEAVLKEQATQGTADGVAYENIMSEDTSLVSAWVETLYQNLAARASDVEGLNYWTTQAIQNGGAAVVAAFAASLAAQGATTEDGQNFAQKQGVADAFTNAFKDFNSLITANEKALVLGNLHTMMDGVNKDSQLDQYTEEIIKIVDEYQNIAAVQFTKADDDNLGIDPNTGESNLKGAANFTGTYNLTDEAKGTIQGSDSATGTEAYLSDTLSVNVTGYDKTTHNSFDLNGLPSTTSVEKLVINNGAASVTGSIGDDFEYVNIKGTGSFSVSTSKDLKDVVLNSAASKEGETNSFVGANVTSLKTAAGNDIISINTVAKSLSTGAGDDNVSAILGEKATADLGAGNDTFNGSLDANASLAGGAGDDTLNVTFVTNYNAKGKLASTIEIDGGTGNDTLDLTTGTATNFQGIKTIKGVEALKVGENTTLMSSAISGQKMTLAGTSVVLNAKGSNGVDLSKMLNAEGEDVAVRVVDVKSGNVNLAYGNKDFNNLKETIVLAKDASKVSIKGFEQGDDFIEIDEAKVNAGVTFFNGHDLDGKATSIDTNNVHANNIYFVDLKEKVTKADLNKLLTTTSKFDNLAAKDVFYIVATDESGRENPNSTAKIYKVEVGKDHKVSKLDQISTLNVADKKVLSSSDFKDSPNYATTDYAPSASGGTITTDGNGGIKIPGVLPDGKTPVTDITVSGSSNKQNITFDSEAGKDTTIKIGASTNGSDAQVAKSITTGAGNDTIEIKGSQRSTNDDLGLMTKIDGGKGTNTLKLDANVALENIDSIVNIAKIDATTGGALIAAKGVSGLKTTLDTGTDKTLILWGDNTGASKTIDLSGFSKANDASGATISLQLQKDTMSVKLNKTGNVEETIKINPNTLENKAGGVTITGIANGDKLDINSVANMTATSFTQITSAITLADGSGYYVDAGKDINTVELAKAKLVELQVKDLSDGSGAVVAFNNGEKSFIYSITGVGSSVTTIDDTLKLISVVDNAITADTVASGVITFA